MKCLWLILLLPFVGCVNIQGTRTAPDGTQLNISANRFLWASQDIEFTTTDTAGLKVGLKVGNSRVDVEAVNALSNIASAMVAGAAKP